MGFGCFERFGAVFGRTGLREAVFLVDLVELSRFHSFSLDFEFSGPILCPKQILAGRSGTTNLWLGYAFGPEWDRHEGSWSTNRCVPHEISSRIPTE